MRHFIEFLSRKTSPMATWSTGSSLQLCLQEPLLGFARARPINIRFPLMLCCGLRGAGLRKPLWRERVISTEAIHAVQALKLANSSFSSTRVEEVLDARLGRLLKFDQLVVLVELQRQNKWQLALQVFAFIRKEVWYKPDLALYGDLIFMLGKNKLIKYAEDLVSELRRKGLEPDTRVYTEMIGAFFQCDQVEKAMDMYKSMKDSSCRPDKLTLTILIRNLENVGRQDLACEVRKDCAKYVEFFEKFLEEVDKKFQKRRSLKIV